ncbi:MAG: hydrogenase maturation nickel metallochaperone HypA [Candidatus Thermoplasmatota archaeon]
MHEISVASNIVDELLLQAKNKKIGKIKKVFLEVGELTSLGIEQLKFAYGILAKDEIIKGSKLKIIKKKAFGECSSCKKNIRIFDKNLSLPILFCKKCNKRLRIISGNETIIRKIVCAQ